MAVFTEIVFAMLLAFFLLAAGDTFRRKVAKHRRANRWRGGASPWKC